ncbi:MAG: EAL domain-containing protein [Burkholderiaceae bacterium]|nr:EAL domain-containing protein [Burkholderiaceae bacterium]
MASSDVIEQARRRPADAPAERPSASRLTPAGLMDAVQSAGSGRAVLLVVEMNRSDKLQALSQQPYAKQVLAEVARRVQAMLRPDDRYAFVTPDLLWVMLRNLPSEALGELAGRTLRENLSRPIPVRRDNGTASTVHLRPVVGGAWIRNAGGVDSMALLAKASEAQHRARSADDHLLIDQLEDAAALERRDILEAELRKALHENELDVHFQPQVDVPTGRCISVEALIRWTKPNGQSVNPATVASICEERGMMGQLTQFVLNTSLRHLKYWRTKGIDLSVGINLSAVTLADNNFPALVGQALATWDVPGDHLTLELTESAIVQNEATAIEFMNLLRSHGCRLAIDDFGTGYSSFSYLRKFPLNELKIDQSFVRNMTVDQGDRQIVHALIDLSHTFEMHALAEGVESLEVLQALNELGCNRAQGYYFSKALSPKDLPEWVSVFNARPL